MVEDMKVVSYKRLINWFIRGSHLKANLLIKEKFLVAKETKYVYNVTCDMLLRNK